VPASAIGADVGLGRTALCAGLAWIWLGALRPELHARRPLRVGDLVLAPASERVTASGWVGALARLGGLVPAAGMSLSIALRTGG
jgi:hypothetical protein